MMFNRMKQFMAVIFAAAVADMASAQKTASVPVAADSGDSIRGAQQERNLAKQTKLFYGVGLISKWDSCFDRDRFCDWVYTNAYSYWKTLDDPPVADGYAYARFVRHVSCYASSRAAARFSLLFSAKGAFSVTRHGNYGAVTDVDLYADLTDAHVLAVSSDSYASALAETGNSWYPVYAFSAAIANDCTPLYGWLKYLCQRASSSASALASASATSYSSSYSSAYSAATGSSKVYVNVDGKNIQSLSATLMASTSNYADATSSSFTAAIAEAYAGTYASACAEVCKRFGYWSDCDWACGWAVANAESFAQNYAQAVGKAVAKFGLDMSITAEYVNLKGKHDHMDIAGKGYAAATLQLTCSANA